MCLHRAIMLLCPAEYGCVCACTEKRVAVVFVVDLLVSFICGYLITINIYTWIDVSACVAMPTRSCEFICLVYIYVILFIEKSFFWYYAFVAEYSLFCLLQVEGSAFGCLRNNFLFFDFHAWR